MVVENPLVKHFNKTILLKILLKRFRGQLEEWLDDDIIKCQIQNKMHDNRIIVESRSYFYTLIYRSKRMTRSSANAM